MRRKTVFLEKILEKKIKAYFLTNMERLYMLGVTFFKILNIDFCMTNCPLYLSPTLNI